MIFVQTMSFTCGDEDALIALFDVWEAETVEAMGFWQSVIMKDMDRPDGYTVWVQFSSYEEAMRNSARPETDANARKLRDLVGDIEYRNYDLIGGAASVIGPGR